MKNSRFFFWCCDLMSAERFISATNTVQDPITVTVFSIWDSDHMWVPLCPNMPNSTLRYFRTVLKITLQKYLMCWSVRLKFPWFKRILLFLLFERKREAPNIRAEGEGSNLKPSRRGEGVFSHHLHRNLQPSLRLQVAVSVPTMLYQCNIRPRSISPRGAQLSMTSKWILRFSFQSVLKCKAPLPLLISFLNPTSEK